MTTSYNYFASSYPRAVYQSNLSNDTNNYFASSNSSAGQQTMRPRNALLTAVAVVPRPVRERNH
jgi:hypothetical protein